MAGSFGSIAAALPATVPQENRARMAAMALLVEMEATRAPFPSKSKAIWIFRQKRWLFREKEALAGEEEMGERGLREGHQADLILAGSFVQPRSKAHRVRMD